MVSHVPGGEHVVRRRLVLLARTVGVADDGAVLLDGLRRHHRVERALERRTTSCGVDVNEDLLWDRLLTWAARGGTRNSGGIALCARGGRGRCRDDRRDVVGRGQ